MQNSIVLVASIPVLNPPQKITPEKKPDVSKASSEYFALGFLSIAHSLIIFAVIKILPLLQVHTQNKKDRKVGTFLSLLQTKNSLSINVMLRIVNIEFAGWSDHLRIGNHFLQGQGFVVINYDC